MPNVYLILPCVVQHDELIKSNNFVSAEYEIIGDNIYVCLNFINKSESFYNWLYFINKQENNLYNIDLNENDISKIKCTYFVPKNKILFCKSILTNCMQNINMEYVKKIIAWYK